MAHNDVVYHGLCMVSLINNDGYCTAYDSEYSESLLLPE